MPSFTTSPEAVLQQLEKILASGAFRNAGQSSKLLRFLVEAVVAGREDLKEYTLGSEGLGRGENFDPRIDPIARVEASRLRSRLNQYYLIEGREDEIFLRLPIGAYVPQIELRNIPHVVASSPRLLHLRKQAWALAAALGILAMGAIFWRVQRDSGPYPQSLVRLEVDLDQGEAIGTQVGSASAVVSPDGSKVVYISVASNQLPRLFLRRLDQTEASPSLELPGTDGARGPFFSPDGGSVAFWASGKLKKIALDGGTPVDICDIPDLLGGTWGEDGDIVGSSGRDLWKVSANGGSPKSLDVMGSWPEHVQGSPVLLYTAGTVTHDIAAFSPRDAQHRVLVRGATYPRYLPDRYHSGGYLLYVNNGTLFAVRFDPLQLEIKGRAAAILQDVSYSDTFGSAQFDVSRDGTLIYRSAPGHGQVTAQWLNARGQLKPLLSKPDAYSWPKLSPDGTRIVFVLDRGDSHDVWSYDSSRGQMTKLISASYNAMAPRWTPDGRFVVFGAARNGVMTVSADGSGKEHLATKHEWLQVPGGFSPDGKYLALHQRVSGPFQIWIAPVQQESDALLISPPEPFHQSNTFETYPSFSDDGHWIAYTSIDSGTYEVYVRAFPDNGSVRQVSVGGGTQGIWAGHKLFYRRNDNRLMVLTYHTNAGKFVADPPRLWSDVQIADTGVLPNFDASLDGRHVVVLMPATLDTLRRTHVTFLIHFTDLLRERIPGPRR